MRVDPRDCQPARHGTLNGAGDAEANGSRGAVLASSGRHDRRRAGGGALRQPAQQTGPPAVMAEVRLNHRSFNEGVRAAGPLAGFVRGSGYRGWLVVEAEQDPGRAPPNSAVFIGIGQRQTEPSQARRHPPPVAEEVDRPALKALPGDSGHFLVDRFFRKRPGWSASINASSSACEMSAPPTNDIKRATYTTERRNGRPTRTSSRSWRSALCAQCQFGGRFESCP